MNHYVHEILHNVIFTYLKFYDKHVFQKLNKYTNTIYIKYLLCIYDRKYINKLDDNILKTYKHATKIHFNKIKIILTPSLCLLYCNR